MQAVHATKYPSTLPISMLIPGRNPRTYFEPTELEELRQLIRAQGVNQPILVRPKGDRYEIIAGYRRVRVATDEFGVSYEIPVLVKEMTDEDAEVAAVTENTGRAAMSPTEEAVEASRVLGRAKGDRNEAARILGWSPSTLDKRLALLNCADSVQKALNERSIDLGHAELLASLARESQERLLPVILSEKRTVAELKATIQQIASKLDAAIFDKDACTSCPHNSTLQTSMFGESITSGSCTNPKCYAEKTEAALVEIADGLKDEYPVIRIVRAGDNLTLTKLEATGPKGVGEEQAAACKACAEFGAAVSALPHALGKVYRGQCFDTACNTKKVAARIKADQDEKAKLAPKPADTSVATKASTPSTGESAERLTEKPVTSISETERVKAYRVQLWRDAMKAEIVKSSDLSVQYLIAMCLNGCARNIDSTKLGQAFKKLTGTSASTCNLADNLVAVNEAEPAARSNMLTLLAATAVSQIEETYLRQLATFHELDLTKHWKLNKEFLDLLTKSEIEVLAKDLGLDKRFGESFKKLLGEKKPDLIDKLLKVDGFNYSATIPKVLKY